MSKKCFLFYHEATACPDAALRKDTDFALRDVPLSDIWTLSGCGRANAMNYLMGITVSPYMYIYIPIDG